MTQNKRLAEQEAEEESERHAEAIGERTNYTLRIEGMAYVPWFMEDTRVKAHTLIQLATQLGLQVFYAAVDESQGPNVAPLNKRWTFRRVGADQVYSAIITRPGIKFEDLLDLLYRETPWTAEARRSARNKLRQTLFKLRQAGRVVKRFDDAATERWQVPDLATGLRLTAAGPCSERPDEAHLPRSPLVDDLEAAADILRKHEVFSKEALRRDPTLYLDLVRSVLAAASDSRAFDGLDPH